MAGEIKPGDLYRKCPGPKCHYGTISEYEQGPNATHSSTCRTCNGVGFVRVDAPAPTDALRAAINTCEREIEEARRMTFRAGVGSEQGVFNIRRICADAGRKANDAFATLRAALDGVPAPVALTNAEMRSLADAVFSATNDEMSVSFVLAKLRELRPELDWLVAK